MPSSAGPRPAATHVALVSDAAYVPWTAVAIRSCLDHLPADVPVHLFHDGSLDPSTVASLAAMAADHAAPLEVHEVDPGATAHLPALDRFGRIVWLRFLLPELLPDVERVLYLDADTLVVDALAPLLDSSLDGAPIGAVQNVLDEGGRSHVAGLGLEAGHRFFNSGVLLMDLVAMRAEGTAATLFEVARDRGPSLRWPDQDALNIVFDGRWQPLHPRWNAQNSFWGWPTEAGEVFGAGAVEGATRDPGIVHFEGPSLCKPWHHLNRHVWRQRYWEVLARTPWAGTPEEDRTLATRLIARLPNDHQESAFLRLARWRARPQKGKTDMAATASRLGNVSRSLRSRLRSLRSPAPAPSGSGPAVEDLMTPGELAVVERCRPHSLASAERLLATMDAVEHVARSGVPGALVECGVWRGGSVLAMVLTLQRLGMSDRDVYLYDTFEGMTEPTVLDTSPFDRPAHDTWGQAVSEGRQAWAHMFDGSTFGRPQVEALLASTGYPTDRLHFVEGPVGETLLQVVPAQIALLRLDTDWYESTRDELVHLYPNLSPGGVLIIDDYGHWDGARRAVDEYFEARGSRPLFARTDYTGRMGVKPG